MRKLQDPQYLEAKRSILDTHRTLVHVSKQTITHMVKKIKQYGQENPHEHVPTHIVEFLIYMLVEKGFFQNAVAKILEMPLETLTTFLRSEGLSEKIPELKFLIFDQEAFERQFQEHVTNAKKDLQADSGAYKSTIEKLETWVEEKQNEYPAFEKLSFAEIVLHLHWKNNITVEELSREINIAASTLRRILKKLNCRTRTIEEALEQSWQPGGNHWDALRCPRNENWGEKNFNSVESPPTMSTNDDRLLLQPNTVENTFSGEQLSAIRKAQEILKEAQLDDLAALLMKHVT